jgi:hypothetical protein
VINTPPNALSGSPAQRCFPGLFDTRTLSNTANICVFDNCEDGIWLIFPLLLGQPAHLDPTSMVQKPRALIFL